MTSHHNREVGRPSLPRSDLYKQIQVNNLEETVRQLEECVIELTKRGNQHERDLEDLKNWMNCVMESGKSDG